MIIEAGGNSCDRWRRLGGTIFWWCMEAMGWWSSEKEVVEDGDGLG